ncbi:MAG: ABC transporter ATP-binding protein [Symbiobacterium sp.]|uniref:ABC transporter ATP binding protein n=1 Tax=Symbiobacterium thermophilum (strain DSM 24528 / JCM 14929 / IAM 14863 / T) TaxID=292459 RepID=Q67SR1_SYMTH|nr:ABC transporter ATP-binding protein [Symbiobacterium thermophilum]BAD39282.1 ABC transporter ATP binding protein [Symbiobacterium thermophilum IAM 14863]
MTQPILEVKNLTVEFTVHGRTIRACDNVSLTINRGEIVGIIGESGSGKSTLVFGILNLIQAPGKITSGEVIYYPKDGNPVDLRKLTPQDFARYRWTYLTTVFQAAQNVLNPTLRVKEHFLETAWAHNPNMPEEEILAKARDLLSHVRLEERVLDCYPHQLSGGMKQRTIIALSLILDPDIIFLDEPTTALDVITQWYILEILRRIQKEYGLTMVFCTHDVSIIGSIVDRLGVMYAGQLVEFGPVLTMFKQPTHPYTAGLMSAIPSLRDDVTKRKAIPGHPPDLANLPDSCRFAPRCFACAKGICDGDRKKTEQLYPSHPGQYTRCYSWEKVFQP